MNLHARERDHRGRRLDDAVDHLERLVIADPEAAILLDHEPLRVCVTDAMQQARQRCGLMQTELSERMRITRGRVSRLESAHYGIRLGSLVAYLHAVGARLVVALKGGDTLIEVAYPAGTQVVASSIGAGSTADLIDVEGVGDGEDGGLTAIGCPQSQVVCTAFDRLVQRAHDWTHEVHTQTLRREGRGAVPLTSNVHRRRVGVSVYRLLTDDGV